MTPTGEGGAFHQESARASFCSKDLIDASKRKYLHDEISSPVVRGWQGEFMNGPGRPMGWSHYRLRTCQNRLWLR